LTPKRASSRKTYVALLRGINVSGHNKVSMADLRALFLNLGGEDVTTYVQSGNVVFKSTARSSAELTGAIEKRIRRDLDLNVTVLLRAAAQLAEIAAGNPFVKSGGEPRRLHVTFLADAPDRARFRELEAKHFGPDEFRVAGPEIYLHCPNGYGRTKLNNTFFERQLAVAATTRNWTTVTKLAGLAATHSTRRA
jgi:uncharacterized protein (DUF1697 family)